MKKKKLPILYTNNDEWCGYTATGWTYIFMDNEGHYKIAKTPIALKTATKKKAGYENYEFVIAFVGMEVCKEFYKALKEHRCNFYIYKEGDTGREEKNYLTDHEAKSMKINTPKIKIYRSNKILFRINGHLSDVIKYLFDTLENRGYFSMLMTSEEEVLPLSHPTTQKILKDIIQKQAVQRMKTILKKESDN